MTGASSNRASPNSTEHSASDDGACPLGMSVSHPLPPFPLYPSLCSCASFTCLFLFLFVVLLLSSPATPRMYPFADILASISFTENGVHMSSWSVSRMTDLNFERPSATDGEMSSHGRCWQGPLARADVACLGASALIFKFLITVLLPFLPPLATISECAIPQGAIRLVELSEAETRPQAKIVANFVRNLGSRLC
jgi:hypothetical protein